MILADCHDHQLTSGTQDLDLSLSPRSEHANVYGATPLMMGMSSNNHLLCKVSHLDHYLLVTKRHWAIGSEQGYPMLP